MRMLVFVFVLLLPLLASADVYPPCGDQTMRLVMSTPGGTVVGTVVWSDCGWYNQDANGEWLPTFGGTVEGANRVEVIYDQGWLSITYYAAGDAPAFYVTGYAADLAGVDLGGGYSVVSFQP